MVSNIHRAKNSKSLYHISLIANDHYTARCRCSKKIFKSIGKNVKIGSIVHIRIRNLSINMDINIENSLYKESLYYDVLCTLWPDHNNYLEEDYLYIDDSVVIGNNPRFSWITSSCELRAVYDSTNLTSFHVKEQSPPPKIIQNHANNNNHNNHGYIAKNLLGMPLCNDLCQITIKQKGVEQMFSIKSIFPSKIGVVHTSTLAIEDNSSSTSTSTNESHSKPTIITSSRYSNISVVKEIIHRIIIPACIETTSPCVKNNSAHHCISSESTSTLHRYQGVLLLGPPGVGKTYALKAVQHLCKDLCQIRVLDVSIPSLLSDVNPIEQLEKIFQQIAIPITTAAHQRNFSTISSVDNSSSNIQIGKVLLSPTTTKISSSNPTPNKISLVNVQTPQNASDKGASTGTDKEKGKFSFTNKNYKTTPLSSTTASSSLLKKKNLLSSPIASGSVAVIEEKPVFYFILFDEIDALSTVANMHNETQIAIKQYLCNWFDRTSSLSTTADYCIIGTSNRSSDIDQCLRRGGRFDYEISVTNTQTDRYLILKSLLQASFGDDHTTLSSPMNKILPHEDDILVSEYSNPIRLLNMLLSSVEVDTLALELANHTGGYVAADLSLLVQKMTDIFADGIEKDQQKEMKMMQYQNNINQSVHHTDNNKVQMNNLSIKEESSSSTVVSSSTDKMKTYHTIFTAASKSITPSCLRSALSVKLPDLSYADVIGYDHIKQKLRNILSVAHPSMNKQLRHFHLSGSLGGVLLHGPPGNSKTRLLTAAAADHKLPMITLSAADVYSAYVGDAEAEIRKAFQIARQASPCVLFFDELDSIVTNRSNNTDNSSTSASVEGRVLATLLTEMDGIIANTSSDQEYNGVIVVAATNRVDFIDAALLRKGRFHHVLYVPPPNEEEQKALVQYFLTKYYNQQQEYQHQQPTRNNNSNSPTLNYETLIDELQSSHVQNHFNDEITLHNSIDHQEKISSCNDTSVDSNIKEKNDLHIHIANVIHQLKEGQSGAEIENICKQYVLQPYL